MRAAQGYRMPEDVLAEIAGLNTHEDLLKAAMVKAELVMAWAHGGGDAEGKAAMLPSVNGK
jgi:hypothetical protein